MDKTVMAYGKTFDALKANILTAALPYVQKYNGKTIVIKYGGNAMASETLKLAVMQDIILLSLIGIKVVLVHGGGPEITRNMQAMGLESKFINGLRYTDSKSVEVVQMTLCGKTNKDLVKLIGCCGGKAIGLCGLDGGMIGAKKIDADPDLGFVGDIISVNTQPITDIMSCGYIPVIAALGSDENGQVYNINADTAAAAIAKALKAESIILMTDVVGLLRDPEDPSSLISEANFPMLEELMADGTIPGGMIPKARCCIDAVEGGVGRAFMIDGRVEHAILIEIFSDEGIGTMVYK